MNRSRNVFIALMLLFSALFGIAPVFAEHDKRSAKEKREQFELSVDCKPVYLVVEDVQRDADATKIRLTRRDIVAAAESRLRSARISIPLI